MSDFSCHTSAKSTVVWATELTNNLGDLLNTEKEVQKTPECSDQLSS